MGDGQWFCRAMMTTPARARVRLTPHTPQLKASAPSLARMPPMARSALATVVMKARRRRRSMAVMRCSFLGGETVSLPDGRGLKALRLLSIPAAYSVILAVAAVAATRDGEPDRDHRSDEARYRDDPVDHGSSSLCSWGIGSSPMALVYAPILSGCKPTGGGHTNSGGGHTKGGGATARGHPSWTPTPSRNRGTPIKRGGRGVNTGGGVTAMGVPHNKHTPTP
nr:MAG TPA: hypothetical protein [Caudoviricetes sp.]